MNNIESLIKNLPDPEAARRFYENFSETSPSQTKKLTKNTGLLSDVLTISSFSPLLAATILQNPTYVSWLERQRKVSGVKEKDELVESLARFELTNSQLEPNVMLARFRRRELIRIYLKDIRRLGTITEITEELSNLADAVLEFALRIARQELDNRYGIPLDIDEKGRAIEARFCVVALGKLGSKELNYSSDIDLLFLYSENGSTSGQGSRSKSTNKEYFVKIAEQISGLVGDQSGEGAAYRVDMRLRPHGRVGALAITLKEAVGYYQKSAQMWEKQVLIRSRASAGNEDLYQNFFEQVASSVFSSDVTVEDALQNVRRSKEKIDSEKFAKNGFDVKLGKGGIREIEFIAQALQLAFGGSDPWLRSPHTLISLARIADRKLITDEEFTALSDAYDFLRRVEHNVQMEHGLQTHFVPDDLQKRLIISQRMGIHFVADFNTALSAHTTAVTHAFTRIFGEDYVTLQPENAESIQTPLDGGLIANQIAPILASIRKSDVDDEITGQKLAALELFSDVSPPFAEMLAANPDLVGQLPDVSRRFRPLDYRTELEELVAKETEYPAKLSALRKNWSRFMIEIATFDVNQKLTLSEVKAIQTNLAEAAINVGIQIAKAELQKDLRVDSASIDLGVLGLGKLGGGGMDYGSDLDLVLIFDDEKPCPAENLTHTQVYEKAAGIFVTALSSLTRDGSLYRVDLRLRPDGKNGSTVIGKKALVKYLEERAAIWEWLAYVKLRGIGAVGSLACSTEIECRKTIHEAASRMDAEKLRQETWRIRNRLENEKSISKKGKEIDIKFSEGGLQDIYFSVRYLQLKDQVMDDLEDRSTIFSLEALRKNESLAKETADTLSEGYRFISALDHALRLTVGRSKCLPLANKRALNLIAHRLGLESTNELLEKLTFHRLNIRSAFESIIEDG